VSATRAVRGFSHVVASCNSPCWCGADSPISYAVERRFGDFEALWKYLSVVAFRLPVQLPEMPVGGVKTFLSRNESSVVSARRVAFQRLLVLIADTPALQLLSPVVSFLLPTATALTGMRRASFTSGASLMATSSVMLGTSGIMAAPASSRMTPPSLVTPALSRRMLVPVRGPGTSGGAAAAAAMTTPALVAVASTPTLATMAATPTLAAVAATPAVVAVASTPTLAAMAGAGSRTP
jgi:hypothetical protein